MLFTQNSLQIKFIVPLLESKPAKLSCEIKKDDKVGNKNGHKNKGKEEIDRNRFAKFWLMRMREKQKSCLHPISRKYVFSVSKLFFFLAIHMVTGRKTVQKGRFGQKCGNLQV